jgi:hypothetical protein
METANNEWEGEKENNLNLDLITESKTQNKREN